MSTISQPVRRVDDSKSDKLSMCEGRDLDDLSIYNASDLRNGNEDDEDEGYASEDELEHFMESASVADTQSVNTGNSFPAFLAEKFAQH